MSEVTGKYCVANWDELLRGEIFYHLSQLGYERTYFTEDHVHIEGKCEGLNYTRVKFSPLQGFYVLLTTEGLGVEELEEFEREIEFVRLGLEGMEESIESAFQVRGN